MYIRDDLSVKWPEKIRVPPERRNPNKYYLFHQDHGYDTNDYFDLKEKIKVLIQ